MATWLGVALALSTAHGCGPGGSAPTGSGSVSETLLTLLDASAGEDRALRSFYNRNAFRPLWVRGAAFRPEAQQLVNILSDSGRDGLDPERYDTPSLARALKQTHGGDPVTLAQTELLLSRAFVRYVLDLHRPASGARMVFTDPAMAPQALTSAQVLKAAADAGSLREQLLAVQRMNPLYEGLREGLSAYRARWSRLPQVAIARGPPLAAGSHGERVFDLRRRLGLSVTTVQTSVYDQALMQAVRSFQQAHGLAANGIADVETINALNAGAATYERLILANMDRARALPVNPGRRYILVDAAAARLWAYEDGRVRDTMRVIVGKPSQQTPAMAGVIRFALINPYWNMPPDLARDRLAPRVLEEGSDYLRRARFEILSDWSDTARVLDPEEVDWSAVATGRRELRVRQLPGADNSMGAIKFMMPNTLGIYLHDTPDKDLFRRTDRRLSAGCVRVEDARRLSRWLFGGDVLAVSALTPEQRKNLPVPVPVYITYLTAAPAPEGIVFRSDVYGRDAVLLAQMDGQAAARSAKVGERRSARAGGV